jgi:hypothetical protein
LSKTTATEAVHFDANQTGKLYDVNMFERARKSSTQDLSLTEGSSWVSRVNRNDLTAFGVLSMRAVQRQAAELSVEGLLNERPEYLVVNGSVCAISKLLAKR